MSCVHSYATQTMDLAPIRSPLFLKRTHGKIQYTHRKKTSKRTSCSARPPLLGTQPIDFRVDVASALYPFPSPSNNNNNNILKRKKVEVKTLNFILCIAACEQAIEWSTYRNDTTPHPNKPILFGVQWFFQENTTNKYTNKTPLHNSTDIASLPPKTVDGHSMCACRSLRCAHVLKRGGETNTK